MSNLKTLLTIEQRPKSIPYAAADYADGEHNYGFTRLKGRADLIGEVEEAKEVPCYQALLQALNAPESPFFSVACEQAFCGDESGHWASGYVEFAFNFADLVADASNYFALFYHFNYDASAFVSSHDAQFHWIVQPARFAAGPCDGFTCAVWFTTAQFATAPEARAEWDAAVDCFSTFVRSASPHQGPTIY